MTTMEAALVGTQREEHSSEAARAPTVLAGEQTSLHSVNRQREQFAIGSFSSARSLEICNGSLLDSSSRGAA